MSRSQFQSAVLQYTVIKIVQFVSTHEIRRNGFTDIFQDPVVKNLTTAFFHRTSNATLSNTIRLNATTPLGGTRFENPDSFYFSLLPRELLICILLFPLAYYWQILLERAFPTRPRRKEFMYEKESRATPNQEEQIVNRWIAQGRIQRSSILWWNTFLKWGLDVTIGIMWYMALDELLSSWIHWDENLENFKSTIFVKFLGNWFSMAPLSSLMSFIVMPVSKRVVFVSGMTAVEDCLLHLFASLIVPMVLLTEGAQNFMRNMTTSLTSSGDTPTIGRLTIDEL